MIDFKDVRVRHDLAQLVEWSGVALRRRGRHLVGHCPFHPGDRTPSFTIYTETQSFFCFGCGAWGDAVDFVKRLRHLSTSEAVAYLEGKFSQVPPRRPAALSASLSVRRLTAEEQALLDKATCFYAENLRRSSAAQQYLLERGLTAETIRVERIGYCGRPGKLVRTLGIRERRLAQQMGLLNEKERERLWDRLTFPVFRQDRPIWLIGRALQHGTDVKYLGLRLPKPIMGEDSTGSSSAVWVVEGVFDLLLLRQLGRELRRAVPAVALLGTHPTRELIQALRDKSQVFLCLDSDPPGQQAARALRQELGSRANLVELPPRSKDIGELLPDEVKDLVLRAYLAPEHSERR